MKQIPLSGKKGKGLFIILDDADFKNFGNLKWNLHSKGYAVKRITQPDTKKSKILFLHRLLMGNPEGLTVDHINGNKLDNRRENLRVCTLAKNNMNKSKKLTGKHKYKGYALCKQNKNFEARICVNYKKLYLGTFKTEEEAAMAYNEAAYVYFGPFAKLNKVIL
jgi:hypothetical protein